MQEPNNTELKNEEEFLAELEPINDLDDLDDLDTLLAESMELAAKRKAAKLNRGKFENDLFPFELPDGDNWRFQFACAFFVEESCMCGSTSRRFSHFAAFEKFSGKCSGKPTRWVKLKERPEHLTHPRILRKCTPLCSECYDTSEAKVYTDLDQDGQLHLFK